MFFEHVIELTKDARVDPVVVHTAIQVECLTGIFELDPCHAFVKGDVISRVFDRK